MMEAIKQIADQLNNDARQSADIMQMINREKFGDTDYAYQQGRYHEAMTTLRRIEDAMKAKLHEATP